MECSIKTQKNGAPIYSTFIHLITWGCLLSAYPFIFNMILPIPGLSIVSVLTLLVLLLVCYTQKPTLKHLGSSFNAIFCIQLICWLCYIVIHRDPLYIERIIYMIIAYSLLTCLHNCDGGIRRFIEKYNRLICLMGVCGAICFFLVLLLKISPLFEFANKDGRTAYFYGLTSTNTIFGNIIRYAGFFDEPGAMAYWGIWALLFNQLFYQNKKIDKRLSISLIFTFSLAYYIQIFISLLFFKIKSLKNACLITFLIILLTASIYHLSMQYPELHTLTFKRFEQDDSGNLKGDNRSVLAEKAKAVFLMAPVFGVGISHMNDLEYMSDNPYETLAYDGIFGTIIIYLPLLYLWMIGNKKIRLGIIILLIGFLQRPFHAYILYYFIMYSFVLLGQTYQKNENVNL